MMMRSDEITHFKARFVTEQEQEREKFKYKTQHLISNIETSLLNSKRFVKRIVDISIKALNKILWKEWLRDSTYWIIEALLEGLTANFATHTLFHTPFTIYTILAHGILIKQGISIIVEVLKNIPHATNNKVSPKPPE